MRLPWAHGLGVRVVAEGVETPAQSAVLVDMACDLMQGFWFSPPVSADVLAGMLGQQLGQPLAADGALVV